MKKSTRKIVNTILVETGLVVFSIFMFAPIFLAFTMSIQSPEFVFSYPPKIFPRGIHFENYLQALKMVPFLRMMWNSLTIAFFITVGKMVTGTLLDMHTPILSLKVILLHLDLYLQRSIFLQKFF